MTREEQINKAAFDYADTLEIGENRFDYEDIEFAFQSGAEWADEHPQEGLVDLSQVWHDSSEIPQHDALILFQSIYGDILLIRFQDRKSSMATIQRWAYVDDLLPKEVRYEKDHV